MSTRVTFRFIGAVIKRVVSGVSNDELTTRAAALAYYSALSFAPLLVLMIWICASLNLDYQSDLVAGLNDLLGPKASDAVKAVIDNAQKAPGIGNIAGIVSIVITLISASGVFTELQTSINKIWGLQPKPNGAVMTWLRSRLHAFGLLLSLAFLLIVSFTASAAIAILVPHEPVVWHTLEAAISLVVFTAVFATIFKVLPDAIITWHDTLAGALLTSVLFTLGKMAIGMYLDHSSVGNAYGAAGSLMVLLVWVYYAGLILLLGAELTFAVATVRGESIKPSPHAELVRPLNEPAGHHS
ncbi:YihY/virulence factor BrkB family protein [Silvimonas sp. JCM 19000]